MSGAPVVNARLTELLHADGPRVGLAALAMVAVVLTLGMGGLRSGLAALLPLACALVWAGGAIGLAGGTVSVMSVARQRPNTEYLSVRENPVQKLNQISVDIEATKTEPAAKAAR